jgi:photosystem II stability/assembly factor-like uncharacterized protein
VQTLDGGATWQQFEPPSFSVSNFAIHPNITTTVFASDGQYGIWKTTDGGQNWAVSNQGLAGLGPLELAVRPDQPEEVYAVMNLWSGLFKTDSWGTKWQHLPAQYNGFSILLDPFVIDRVYLGGGNHVYISTDGGVTWPLSGTLTLPPAYAGCFGVTVWAIAADPLNAGTLLAGADFPCGNFFDQKGGVYKSTDYGATWTLTAFPQEVNSVIDLAYDPQNSGVVYAATSQTGLFKSTNGGQTWQHIGDQSPFFNKAMLVAVDPVSSQVYVSNGGDVHVSNNGGLTWASTGWLLTQQTYMVTEIDFIGEPPFHTLYQATTDGLFRYNSATPWPWRWTQAAGSLGRANVTALAWGNTADRRFFYAGTVGGDTSVGTSQLSSMDSGDNLVEAGIYRLTQKALTEHVYMPVVLKKSK